MIVKKIIAKIKWWRLKKKLFKKLVETGGDVDGDVITYNGIKYYVNRLSRDVHILSTPVPNLTK